MEKTASTKRQEIHTYLLAGRGLATYIVLHSGEFYIYICALRSVFGRSKLHTLHTVGHLHTPTKLKKRPPTLPPHTPSALAASTSRNILQLQDRADGHRMVCREFVSNMYIRPCGGILCNRRPTAKCPLSFRYVAKMARPPMVMYVCTLEYGRTPK